MLFRSSGAKPVTIWAPGVDILSSFVHFAGSVSLAHPGDHQADATSVLALLGLATTKGDRLTVTARGHQADEAIARIQRLASENFGE